MYAHEEEIVTVVLPQLASDDFQLIMRALGYGFEGERYEPRLGATSRLNICWAVEQDQIHLHGRQSDLEDFATQLEGICLDEPLGHVKYRHWLRTLGVL